MFTVVIKKMETKKRLLKNTIQIFINLLPPFIDAKCLI
jgi:hypothetical protein